MKRSQLLLVMILVGGVTAGLCAGPYPPPAGQSGSTAVYKTDPNILAWADGYQDYLVGADCDYVWQTPGNALGPAEGLDANDPTGGCKVVSLGNGGRITLTFSFGIGDGPGFDFAVFENSVNNYFLELAWVEVSSDGVHFYRFPNVSLTPAGVGPYGIVDAINIDGLAGKYRESYGTPFDLAVLRPLYPALDVNNITYVRIVDIVGDGSCFDSASPSHAIFDPHPTWGSGGFDLDAVAVMNMRTGDFDGDGRVDTADLVLFATAWLRARGDANFDERCDIAGPADGRIDQLDFAVLARQWLAGGH
jgi:hypothetical protein